LGYNGRYGGEAQQHHYTTSTDPETNPFWKAMHGVLEASAAKVEPLVFPAATDSRFLRALNIPCFGFSPMKLCPVLLHEHDEYLPLITFINGISVYEKLLPALLAA
jgi:aminoacylase